jgi:large subunit ribosomal protein LP2
MKYLAAYALVALSGAPTKKNVEATLKAAGVTVDAAKLDAVFAELDGKDVNEVIKAGKGKISIGGGGGAAAPAASKKAAAPAAASKKAAPKEESEEEDDFGMGGLF